MTTQKHHIYTIFTLLTLLALGSCEDNYFDTGDGFHGYGNAIAFDVSSGFGADDDDTSAASRSDDEGLPPVMLTSGSDTLYLHRYVAAEMERATGRGPAQSRSAQVNTVSDFKTVNAGEGFRVSAVYADDGSEFFPMAVAKPDAAENQGDVWMTEQRYYWPDRRGLHFNAYAPSSASAAMANLMAGRELITFDYTVPVSAESPRTDAEMQPDLMFAATDFLHDSKNENCDLAPLNFRHALSAIKFAVRDVVGGTIVDISIKGVAGSGSCTFDSKKMDNPFVWEPGAPVDYVQTFNYETEDTYPDIPSLDKVNVINDKMPEKTFMLIPQQISEDAELEITFRSGGVDKKLSGRLKTADIPLWEAGKEYVYTISTSSENWTYVFEVNGSYRDGAEVYMPCPADDIYKEYVDGGGEKSPYFEVVSYRYRTNNHKIQEPLPWTVTHGDGDQYFYTKVYETFAEKDAILYSGRDKEPSERPALAADVWLTDAKGLYGEGGSSPDRHELSFYPSDIATDWPGDKTMYNHAAYPGNSEDNPWDLSTFGGQTARNTANCYVVDREGWYAIPLYYGNAIKNGEPNPASWNTDLSRLPDKSDGTHTYSYYALNDFLDSKDNPVGASNGEIPRDYCNSARLIWEDAFGVIDHVKLAEVKGENMIVFHVNKENIQQGNALLAVSEHTLESWNKNDTKIAWSWHIWINEHWLNADGLSNAFASEGFDTEFVDRSRMQNQGDLEVKVSKTPSETKTYRISPYNIGWCDAKNVYYLSRYSTLSFVQAQTGKTRALPLIQDGRTIEYKYGNNVYFQFGRKDPFVGFVDHNSKVKEVYGDVGYDMTKDLKSISYAIRNPHQLIVGPKPAVLFNDWNGEKGWPRLETRSCEYYNLWNNDARDMVKGSPNSTVGKMEHDRYYNTGKTVYDPSPAGYTIPPVGFFKILLKAGQDEYCFNDNYTATLGQLNGYQDSADKFMFRIFTSHDSQGSYFTLTSTGHRWYTDQTILDVFYNAGDNFNPQYAYLWTNHVTQYTADRAGFSAAVGCEEGAKNKNKGKWCVTPALSGRKSIARPIRCIQDNP